MRSPSGRRSTVVAILALVIAAAGAGLIATRGSSAHERGARTAAASNTVDLAVGTASTGRPIPPGFLGLSLEYTAIEPYAGTDPKAVNPVFEQLVRNLTPNQSPVLRIGGDSTDWAWWPVPDVAKPHGVRVTLDKRWLHVTAALTHALGAKLILGIDLEMNSSADAAAEADALVHGIGRSSIEALEATSPSSTAASPGTSPPAGCTSWGARRVTTSAIT
jgi:hypothetical protein